MLTRKWLLALAAAVVLVAPGIRSATTPEVDPARIGATVEVLSADDYLPAVEFVTSVSAAATVGGMPGGPPEASHFVVITH
jgi:hypothetical protein